MHRKQMVTFEPITKVMKWWIPMIAMLDYVYVSTKISPVGVKK